MNFRECRIEVAQKVRVRSRAGASFGLGYLCTSEQIAEHENFSLSRGDSWRDFLHPAFGLRSALEVALSVCLPVELGIERDFERTPLVGWVGKRNAGSTGRHLTQ